MMTLRKGDWGTSASGREAAELNHFCASSSKVSTRHGRLDSLVRASLHHDCQCDGIACDRWPCPNITPLQRYA